MRQSVGDMVRSLLVVLAVVVAILLVTWRPQPDPVKVVDVTPAVLLAQEQAEFPVRPPQDLAGGWRATSARWEPTPKSGADPVLHIGYVTPSGGYAQVSESVNRTTPFLAEQTSNGISTGSQAVGDATWQRWERGDRRSLLQVTQAGSIVVSGTAPWTELIALAASLRR